MAMGLGRLPSRPIRSQGSSRQSSCTGRLLHVIPGFKREIQGGLVSLYEGDTQTISRL